MSDSAWDMVKKEKQASQHWGIVKIEEQLSQNWDIVKIAEQVSQHWHIVKKEEEVSQNKDREAGQWKSGYSQVRRVSGSVAMGH